MTKPKNYRRKHSKLASTDCPHCGLIGGAKRRTICDDCLCEHGRLEMLCEKCRQKKQLVIEQRGIAA